MNINRKKRIQINGIELFVINQQMVTNYLIDKEINKLKQTVKNSEASNDVKDFSESLSNSQAK